MRGTYFSNFIYTYLSFSNGQVLEYMASTRILKCEADVNDFNRFYSLFLKNERTRLEERLTEGYGRKQTKVVFLLEVTGWSSPATVL